MARPIVRIELRYYEVRTASRAGQDGEKPAAIAFLEDELCAVFARSGLLI
jgi:hypothetical protein